MKKYITSFGKKQKSNFYLKKGKENKADKHLKLYYSNTRMNANQQMPWAWTILKTGPGKSLCPKLAMPWISLCNLPKVNDDGCKRALVSYRIECGTDWILIHLFLGLGYSHRCTTFYFYTFPPEFKIYILTTFYKISILPYSKRITSQCLPFKTWL